MAAFTHEKLRCWVCAVRPASRVVEAKALPYGATSLDEVESYYQLCCDAVVCLDRSAKEADAHDKVHVDTRLLSRGEAEAISGLDLSAVSRG